jgi:hypothetical protein
MVNWNKRDGNHNFDRLVAYVVGDISIGEWKGYKDNE